MTKLYETVKSLISIKYCLRGKEYENAIQEAFISNHFELYFYFKQIVKDMLHL